MPGCKIALNGTQVESRDCDGTSPLFLDLEVPKAIRKPATLAWAALFFFFSPISSYSFSRSVLALDLGLLDSESVDEVLAVSVFARPMYHGRSGVSNGDNGVCAGLICSTLLTGKVLDLTMPNLASQVESLFVGSLGKVDEEDLSDGVGDGELVGGGPPEERLKIFIVKTGILCCRNAVTLLEKSAWNYLYVY